METIINNQNRILEPEVFPPGTKRLLVKFSGGTRPPQEIIVGPGTNASDLLEHLGMNPRDFNLSLGGSVDSIFGEDEAIYPKVNDGDLLFVTSRVDAGQ